MNFHGDGCELGLAQQQGGDRGGEVTVRSGAGADIGGDLPCIGRGRGTGRVRRSGLRGDDGTRKDEAQREQESEHAFQSCDFSGWMNFSANFSLNGRFFHVS